MKHAMLDIETLGTDPGSVVLSLAAVEFSIFDGDDASHGVNLVTGEEFFRTITLRSSVNAGLKIDPGTLEWWLKQDSKILKESLTNGIPLDDALAQFTQWKNLNGITHLWGNSVRFDLGLLEACYDAAKKSRPWNHRYEMCYRTMKNMFPLSAYERPADNDNHHNPVADCHWQIDYLFTLTQKYGINFEICTQAK